MLLQLDRALHAGDCVASIGHGREDIHGHERAGLKGDGGAHGGGMLVDSSRQEGAQPATRGR